MELMNIYFERMVGNATYGVPVPAPDSADQRERGLPQGSAEHTVLTREQERIRDNIICEGLAGIWQVIFFLVMIPPLPCWAWFAWSSDDWCREVAKSQTVFGHAGLLLFSYSAPTWEPMDKPLSVLIPGYPLFMFLCDALGLFKKGEGYGFFGAGAVLVIIFAMAHFLLEMRRR